jgi:uncharacterized protein YjbJ (UPF0337 family)
MSKLQRKAQGHTKQVVGQMIGDEQLRVEGSEEVRRAEGEGADRKPDDCKKPVK